MIVITALWIGLRDKTRSYLRNLLKIVLRPSVNLAPCVQPVIFFSSHCRFGWVLWKRTFGNLSSLWPGQQCLSTESNSIRGCKQMTGLVSICATGFISSFTTNEGLMYPSANMVWYVMWNIYLLHCVWCRKENWRDQKQKNGLAQW